MSEAEGFLSRLNRLEGSLSAAVERARSNVPVTSQTSLSDRFLLFQRSNGRRESGRRRASRAASRAAKVTFFTVCLLPRRVRSLLQCRNGGGIKTEKIAVPLQLNAMQFRDKLREAFPELTGRVFDYCKVDGGSRVIHLPPDCLTPQQIKDYPTNKRSALYLLPYVALDIPPARESTSRDENEALDTPPARESTSRDENEALDIPPARESTSRDENEALDIPPARESTSRDENEALDIPPARESTSRDENEALDIPPARESTSRDENEALDIPPARESTSRDENEVENMDPEPMSRGESCQNEEVQPIQRRVYVNAGTPTVSFGLPTSETLEERRAIIRATNHAFEESLRADDIRDLDMENDHEQQRLGEERERFHQQDVSVDAPGVSDATFPNEATSSSEGMAAVTRTLQEELFSLSSWVVADQGPNIINVDRHNVLDGAIRAVKRKRFCVTARMSVRFGSEDGIDNGGPRREFLRLCLKEIQGSSLFCGKENRRIISLNYARLEDYEAVGKIIAYGMVHEGALPTFMHPAMPALLAGMDYTPTVSDVLEMDEEMGRLLQKIEESVSSASFDEAVENVCNVAEIAGCVSLCMWRKKAELLAALSRFLFIDRNKEAISRLGQGLEALGVLHSMKMAPETWRAAFVCQTTKLSAAEMECLFIVPDYALSVAGSNKRRAEDRTIVFWRDLLIDMEDDDGLEELLIFATGAGAIPPGGFSTTPTLLFKHPADMALENRVTAEFPSANTCALQLILPIHSQYERFKCCMIQAVKQCTFFTDV